MALDVHVGVLSVQKGAATRVPVAEYKAWVAQLIKDKGLKVQTKRVGQQQQPAGAGLATPIQFGNKGIMHGHNDD